MQIFPQLFAILLRNFWKIHSATFGIRQSDAMIIEEFYGNHCARGGEAVLCQKDVQNHKKMK